MNFLCGITGMHSTTVTFGHSLIEKMSNNGQSSESHITRVELKVMPCGAPADSRTENPINTSLALG